MLLLTVAAAALAQQPAATVPAGVPLRVALEQRVRIKHVGEPVRGRLVEPVYIYDRVAIPAGSVAEGHIAEIGGVPAMRRISAFMSGNLTPPRKVQAQFDTLVLSDGSRLPLHTSPGYGTPHTARVSKTRPNSGQRKSIVDPRQMLADKMDPAILAFKEPGKWTRLKSRLLEMFPYHPQAWPAGTLFSSVLQEPLAGPELSYAEARSVNLAIAAAPGAEDLTARLLTPLSSKTAHRGEPITAVVTQPLFSSDHALLIPEGAHLLGEVVEARSARFFHRSGKVLFEFRQIQLPAGSAQSIQGYLDGVEANFDAHIALDSEGGMRVTSSKTRFIFPAIAAAVAGLSFHQDYNAKGVPDADSAGRAESGAVGMGLIGTVLAQIGPRSVASGFAIGGAAFSMYTTFIARGANVVLPLNTPIKVSLGTRTGQASPQNTSPDNK
jgi:hypothetical protein